MRARVLHGPAHECTILEAIKILLDRTDTLGMTLRVVLVGLVAVLAVSAAPITFTAPSIPAAGPTTAAEQVFTSTTTDTCAAGCSFAYLDSNTGPNGHALFSISTQTGDLGLVGLFGNVGTEAGGVVTSGQTFVVGPIVGSTSHVPGSLEAASVTLPAGIQFILNDGGGTAASDYFTATITSFDMSSIAVSAFQFNLGGTVNLTNFAYTGSNAALQLLRDSAPGVMTENFSFAGNVNLTDLFNSTLSPQSTAFQLSVNTVPEPRFYGLVLFVLLGLAGIAIRRRKSANA